jgi:hypothetical protein
MISGDHRTERWLEALCGTAAAVLGAAGLAFALLSESVASVGYSVITIVVPACAPTRCPQASAPPISKQTVTQGSIAGGQGISGALEVVAIGVGVVLVGIAVGAIMNSATGRRGWLLVLFPATGLLLLATLLTGFSIGFAFLPADAFAIAASALGLARLLERPRPLPS